MESLVVARFFFDYLDPLSYLVNREIEAALEGMEGVDLRRIPLELRPPPLPLLDPDGPWWRERWQAAVSVAEAGSGLREPAILPWTRKAHELVSHARAAGREDDAHRTVFEAVFRHGLDIGRVDVLVELARGLGLDPVETKAVLDVDRYAEQVAAQRGDAAGAAVDAPPALVGVGRTLRGFHNRDAVRTFLLH